jgi:hypothetical protein
MRDCCGVIELSQLAHSFFQHDIHEELDRSITMAGTSVINWTTNSDKSFFRLAAELRNRIYTYVLVDDILVEKGMIMVSQDPIFQACRPPALLHTCRQVRKEASGIYFSQNAFTVIPNRSGKEDTSEQSLVTWLQVLGVVQIALLRDVKVDDYYRSCELEAKCSLKVIRDSLTEAGIGMKRGAVAVEVRVPGLNMYARIPPWMKRNISESGCVSWGARKRQKRECSMRTGRARAHEEANGPSDWAFVRCNGRTNRSEVAFMGAARSCIKQCHHPKQAFLGSKFHSSV